MRVFVFKSYIRGSHPLVVVMKRKSIFQRLPFFYGWIICLMTLLTYLTMYGFRYSIGVFFVPIQNEFGWTKTMTAGAVTVFFWIYGFSGPFVGRLAGKIGVRRAIALGGVLLGLGGALSSFSRELWHLYFFWGVMASVGSAVLYIVPTMVLARFFIKKRGRAVGWASIGVSIGQATLVPSAAWLITKYGWRTTYVVLGFIVIFTVSFLGYLLFRESPESIGLTADGGGRLLPKNEVSAQAVTEVNWTRKEAMSTRAFKYIGVSYFFLVGGVISLLTFVVPHIIQLGIDPLLAAGAFGIIGVMSSVGSFIFGVISDLIGRRYTILATSTGIALSMFVALKIPADIAMLYAWVTLYGLTYGGAPEQYAAIIVDYFGPKNSETLFGYIHLAGGIGGGIFHLIGGYIADAAGNYFGTILFLGVSVCLSVLFIFFSRIPKSS
jgi:MFS family permease